MCIELVRDSNRRTPASRTSENPSEPLCQVALKRQVTVSL